jgi:phosphoribosylglycinamide formyltransferase-1
MSSKKIAVLFSGTGTNFEYLAKNQDGYEIVVALSNNPNAGGIEIAKRYGIESIVIDSKLYDSREEFDSKIVEVLSGYELDLVVLAGFMRILTPIFTNAFRAINLHPSLLPRHKGLQAIQRSYSDKYDEGGVSVHWVSSQLDSGEMILQQAIPKQNLSLDEYTQQIKTIEKQALLEALKKILEI